MDTARFEVKGEGIESIQVQIFDLSGRRIFDSLELPGGTFEWHLEDENGEVVANGVYLYLVTARGIEGQVFRSKVNKLVILR